MSMEKEENSSLVQQSSLANLPSESSGSKQEEGAKRSIDLAFKSIFVHLSNDISMP
jgi:hypothetical protein